MAFFSGISIQKRDSASEADGGELFKGAAFIAAGVLAASFMTMEIASVLKLGLLAVGVVLCAVGMKWIVKYWKDNKAFEEFVPEWDKGRGMYAIVDETDPCCWQYVPYGSRTGSD